MKHLKASKICQIIEGKLYGNPDATISNYATIKNAKKGDITFLSDKRHIKYLQTTKASIIISDQLHKNCQSTIIVVAKPLLKFAEILKLFFSTEKRIPSISKSANIHRSSIIGKNVSIDDFVVIGKNVSIGNDCFIGSNTCIGDNSNIESFSSISNNVTIYNNTQIGKYCTIHAGAVIGSDGFGFIQDKDVFLKMPQLGSVIIKEKVEIGSNTTIDRGTIEHTIIESGVKLDNLIQIGHNVVIGAHSVIAAQTGIAGSTKIGHHCMIGGQVAISEHIEIGNYVKIAGKSGVIKNIADFSNIQGPLAFNIKDFQKSYVHFKKLPDLVSKLKEKNTKK